jgi:PAS domain S-box-containing protein
MHVVPKNREEALSSLWLAAIVESSDDAIISKDLNGTIMSWNRGAERIFGYEAAEMIGKSIRTIIPDDRQIEEDHVLERVGRGERIEHFETIRKTKQGQLIPISLTVSPVRDSSGTIVGASKIARDISERRRAEEIAERAKRQALLVAQVSAVLTQSREIDLTLQGLTNVLVPGIADWCVIDVIRDRQIVRPAVVHVDRRRIELVNVLRDKYGDTDSPFNPSYVMRTRKPAFLPVITETIIEDSAQGNPLRIEACRELGLAAYISVPMIARGRTFGSLTMAMAESGRRYSDHDLQLAEDIAVRAAMAIENAEAYDQLDHANRLKDEFLATLSHEMRTPLNAVLGYARMLRARTLTDERVPRALDVVERNATALTQIVEDVLDVSRIISGKVRLQVQPVDLRQVVLDACETVRPAADAKNLKMQTIVDSYIPPIAGDPDRLQQVVWNLVSNAVKFTPARGRVQVQLLPINSHVEVVVSDTGIGIRPEFLPHIFERFRQAEGGTTRRHGGLGLGLAIARHIVEMHGGTIDVASDGEGKGSTFRVKLPIMIVHRETHPEVERVHPRADRGATLEMLALDGISVLAVDDDEDALGLVREILESAGAQVETAGSSAAALQKLGTFRPDVLIADLGMPHTDGFHLIERVRNFGDPAVRSIPAAALTAYARSEDRSKALRSGFELHLAKPIDPAELVAAVSALSRRNRTSS